MPLVSYQPDFFDQSSEGRRAGCMARLAAIRPYISGNVLDVGCSEGFFSFGISDLAESVLAIDHKPGLIEGCCAQRRIPTVSFRCATLGELLETTKLTWDTVLYLSVHHHVIRQREMREATRQLGALLDRAKRVLFDMGQKNEMGCRKDGWWGCLPATGDPEGWTRDYLCSVRDRSVEKIGKSPIHGIQRALWKIA